MLLFLAITLIELAAQRGTSRPGSTTMAPKTSASPPPPPLTPPPRDLRSSYPYPLGPLIHLALSHHLISTSTLLFPPPHPYLHLTYFLHFYFSPNLTCSILPRLYLSFLHLALPPPDPNLHLACPLPGSSPAQPQPSPGSVTHLALSLT